MVYTTTVTETFATPGEHELTIRAPASDATLRCWGAHGGDAGAGAVTALGDVGGHVDADFSLADGTTLTIGVGGQGGTDGSAGDVGGGAGASAGSATAGGGGGRSDVRTSSSIADALVVAAGGAGGGAAADGDTHDAGGGGQGGADTGQAGADASTSSVTATGGGGGTQSGGGAGGENATSGSQGVGGDGGTDTADGSAVGGGGGGGWYGGGGGGAATTKTMGTNHVAGAGAGGGSNTVADAHADWVATTANQRGVDGSNAGDGYVEVTYTQEVFDISGTVTDETGTAISNAPVYVIRESDFEREAATTTAADGTYSVTGLPNDTTYHVAAQHDDGSTKYAGDSYPFISG